MRPAEGEGLTDGLAELDGLMLADGDLLGLVLELGDCDADGLFEDDGLGEGLVELEGEEDSDPISPDGLIDDDGLELGDFETLELGDWDADTDELGDREAEGDFDTEELGDWDADSELEGDWDELGEIDDDGEPADSVQILISSTIQLYDVEFQNLNPKVAEMVGSYTIPEPLLVGVELPPVVNLLSGIVTNCQPVLLLSTHWYKLV